MADANVVGRYWQDLTPGDVAALAARDAVAVLPLGAIEQHGEHLPLSTDLDIAVGLTRAAVARLPDELPACVLPPLAIGLSLEHGRFAGTLSLSPGTAQAVLVELGESVARAGLRRLVVINAHGGNKAVLDLAALRLRAAHEMLVVKANYFRFAPPPDCLPADELRHGLHGGALETAMMLHLAGERVRPAVIDGDKATDRGDAGLGPALAAEGWAFGPEGEAAFAWLAGDLRADGIAGNPRLATAALGQRLVAHYADRLAAVITDAHRFDLARLRA